MSTHESPQVITQVVERTGIITLDRPKALNSLSYDMITQLADILGQWRDDDAIEQVVIRSAGKHFCSGGDVKAAREGILSGNADHVDRYFEEEYALNLDIARYPKPYIALVGGVDMGGGLGVSAHGSHMVVSEEAFASMPEMNIGFVTDVGMSWLLQNLPGHPSQALGAFLALTGYRLTADDMLATGLATHKVAAETLEGLAERIATEGLGVLDEVALEPGPSALEQWYEPIDALFDGPWADISARLGENPEFAELVGELTAQASPSALVAAAELIRVNANRDLEAALRNELALGSVLTREPDFAEGVRAVLVDKSRDASFAPQPEPDRYRAVLR
ncbi:3-hydroxyisobutyryl-CoA hydrolase [Corynebacterium timonense]|uniref:3-hydroxyisobutyryl-CoA hydrolase n=1 Tax=Corynebacterium timonense TaxID=441500 RepID=A0A1H1QUY2_9CORY|nr:3-hydroxyisobutyryl-CoA hydrolase [Corynebacterium timonense]SDS27298.1 Enoyl-CoA hydratase/carnithine racemase [Corynebacterium timonense]